LTSDEEKELSQAAWFIGDQINKEFLTQILAQEPPGTFLIRKSSSQNGSLALSLKIGVENSSAISDQASNCIAHFLIFRCENGFKFKVKQKVYTLFWINF